MFTKEWRSPDPKYQEILKNNRKCIIEVIYWINRALVSSSFFRGQCTRRLKIPEEEINYYKLGKVFRFQNITSATIGLPDEPENVQYRKDANVTFHIYSTQGRQVFSFLGSKSFAEK